MSAASRWLGLLRDVALAAIFRRDETDAFFVAFTVPSALRHLLGEGAVATAVTPTLTRKLAGGGEASAIAFFQRARGAFAAVLLLVTVLGVVLAEPLTDLLAAGYRARPGEFERTVVLTRTLFPFLFLSGTTAVGVAALELKKRYAFAIVAPILLNVAFLAAIAFLPDLLDARGLDRAQAIACGALVGGALQVGVQLYLLKRAGWGGRAVVDLNDPDVRAFGRRVAPLALGIGVYYLELIISRRFLAELESGAQSWFSWAMRLCEVATGLLVTFGAMPRLGDPSVRRSPEEVAKASTDAMRITLFAAIPASVALVALSEPIVVAVFQHGAFDANSSVQTARALMWQGGAIWAAVTARQLVRAFYALGDNRTPLVVSAVGVAAFFAVAMALKSEMGHPAISAAGGASSLVQLLILLVILKRRLPSLRTGKIGVSAARSLALSLLAAAGAASGALLLSPGSGTPDGVLRVTPAIVGVVVFGMAFLGLSRGLRVPELLSILATRAKAGARS